MARMLLSLFKDADVAETAIKELEHSQFNPKEISLIMRDSARAQDVAESTGVDVVGGTVSGATTGGLIGALVGLLIGVAVPGLGWLLIGGPIAAALGLTGAVATTVSGAVTGALAGGLIGALTSLGVPEEEARIYEERIKEGAVLLLVPVTSVNEESARSVLEQNAEGEVKAVDMPLREVERTEGTFTQSPRYASEVRHREDNTEDVINRGETEVESMDMGHTEELLDEEDEETKL